MSSATASIAARWAGDRGYTGTVAAIALVTLLLPLLGAGPLAGSAVGLSPYLVNLVGQVMCFALLALAHDLVWGYTGYLSLGHGLFFATGGYFFGMHLVKEAFSGVAGVPVFLRYMGLDQFPSYWFGFESLAFTLLVITVATLLIAFLIGYLAFRSRVVGVYFAIITQAFVYVAMLVMSRNDTGFGGNNGISGFTTLFGLKLNDPGMVVGLAMASGIVLLAALILLRALVRGPVGRLLVGIRDDEDRLRVLGYETLWVKVAVWCLSALLAAVAGMLYVPQIGVASPQMLSPLLSLEVAVWVAIGGRGYLFGAVIGAVVMNVVKFWLTRFMPELWPFLLAGIVLLVVVILENGLTRPGDWLGALRRWPTAAGPQTGREGAR